MATPDPAALPPTITLSSSSPSPGTDYTFPREYHFPPFFTRQTNLTTHRSQLEKWSDLILGYCAHYRLYKISLGSPRTEDLFWNKRLNRRLSVADARDVLEFMRKDRRAEFVSSVKGDAGDVVWIYWKTPEEWARELENWVDETAQKNTVLTLYELTEGEGTRGAAFHGLDPDLLQKALQVLVKRGKAQIFGQEDQQGVKFF